MSLRSIRVLFLAIGAGLGVMYPFITVILVSDGLSVATVGTVNALSALAFTMAVPAWGHLADERFGRARALQIAFGGAALAVAITVAPVAPLILAACFICFAIFESAFAPLSDALAVNSVGDPRRHYAAIRVLASGSFAAGTIGSGFVYDHVGYGPAPLFFVGCASVAVVAAAATTDLHVSRSRSRPRFQRPLRLLPSVPTGSVGVAFSTAPRLPKALLAIGLVHVGILGGFTFLAVRLHDLGAGPSIIGLSSGISSIAEIPGFLLAALFLRHFGVRTVFALGALLYCACFICWATVDVPILLVGTRLLTGMALAAVTLAAVLTMATLLPVHLQATGQTLYQSMSFGLAAVLANFTGGFIYSGVGPSALFGTFAVLAVVAAAVGWVVLPHSGSGKLP